MLYIVEASSVLYEGGQQYAAGRMLAVLYIVEASSVLNEGGQQYAAGRKLAVCCTYGGG